MKEIDKLKKKKKIISIINIILITWLIINIYLAFNYEKSIFLITLIFTIIATIILNKIIKKLKIKIDNMDTIEKSIKDSKN